MLSFEEAQRKFFVLPFGKSLEEIPAANREVQQAVRNSADLGSRNNNFPTFGEECERFEKHGGPRRGTHHT